MSGGHFDYMQYRVNEAFRNQWCDEEINELFYDLFNAPDGLVETLDLYRSYDIGEERYREHVQEFKDKWFGRTKENSVELYSNLLQKQCDRYKKELAGVLMIEGEI